MATDNRWDHLFNDIPKALESDIPDCFIAAFRSSGLPCNLKRIRDDPDNGRNGSRNATDPNNDNYARALTNFRSFLKTFNGSKKKETSNIVKCLFENSYDTSVAEVCDPNGRKREIWMSNIIVAVDIINERSGF